MATVSANSIVGLPQPTIWSNSITNILEHSSIFFVYTVLGENADKLGSQVEILIKKNKSNTDGSAEFLYTLLTQAIELIPAKNSISCALLFVSENSLVAATYNATVMLARNGKHGQLVGSKNEIQVVEGKSKKNDLYLLLTENSQIYSDEILLKLRSYTPKTVIESVANDIHDLEDNAAHALTLVDYSDADDTIMMEPITTFNQSLNFQDIQAVQEMSKQEPLKIKNNTTTFKHLMMRLRNFKKILSFAKNLKKRIKNLQKKQIIILLIIFVVLLCVGVLVSQYISTQRATSALLNQRLQPIRQKLGEIKNTENGDVIALRDETSDTIQELQKIKEDYEPESNQAKTIDKEIEFASSVFDSLTGTTEIQDMPIYFNLSNVSQDFIGSKLIKSGKTIIAFDEGKDSVIYINTDSKESVVAQHNTQIRDLVAIDQRLYLLGDGVYTQDTSSTVDAVRVIEADELLNETVGVAAFENFLYFYNPVRRNIYRYNLDDLENTEPTSWLRSTKGIDFDTVEEILVDGHVWLTTNTGKIIKFLRGNQVEFIVPTLSTPLESSIKLSVSEDQSNMYILEPSQSRVVVLTKEGSFVREIKSSNFASAVSIAADEESRVIYILNGSLIFAVNY